MIAVIRNLMDKEAIDLRFGSSGARDGGIAKDLKSDGPSDSPNSGVDRAKSKPCPAASSGREVRSDCLRYPATRR